ncbi:MBOAT family O-acyltransferase [Kineothrix sp. MB12-C1]|uniref:MBOAT family O-acyltransferase n=1 Tax=Kineothrix sp. MB12-C1 TaxID=3070215 RepID=UPI0027D2B40A|nr:MBOAT family O-acyltransferase [Kineothrix sp. MB12-C1]WMC92307.1 MBOAT family O-acyltransferase [Kineothrix sp. MB12-C1]
MIFNSYIFVLLFFPIVIIGYYFFIYLKKYQMVTFYLIVTSLFFYGYKNPLSLVLLFLSILVNYLFYKSIKTCYSKNLIRLTPIFLVIGIVSNIGMLLYFKYYNFFIDNVNMMFETRLSFRSILLPLGISFITFQQIAFLVDTYHKEVPDYNLLDYTLFISYFPRVISGPIILHNDFFSQLSENKRKMNWDFFASGLYLFVMGLGKKVIIADMFAKSVNWGYSNIGELNTPSALFISIAYSIQIYFDFSGYSDMAIGISRMLQIDLPVNFNSPYKANTILDFWDRWHITLTRFLTKYLYIPIGGNRKGSLRTYLNIFIVFLCSGLWHGASWTFIIWGILHGCFMIFTKRFTSFINKVPKIINKLATLLFVNFTWILFRSESFNIFKQMIRAILQNQWGRLNETMCGYFQPVLFENLINIEVPYWIWAILAFVAVFIIIFRCKNVMEKATMLKYSTVSILWTIVVALISILSFSGISTFVYSRF